MRKWLQFALLATFLLFLAKSTSAQGSLADLQVWRYTPAGAFPASGATVTICTSSGLGQPCAPKLTIYSDSALTQPVANPLAACTISGQIGCLDGLGNATFYMTPGPYTYTITGAGLNSYGPIARSTSCIPGSTCVTYSTPGTFSALQTFSAGITVQGLLACKNFENSACLDAANNPGWSGSDIGAQFNSAYASSVFPSTGGLFWQGCKQDGTQYNFTTPIVLNTSGKFVSYKALGTTNHNSNGCALNYTPTSATTAFTLDTAPLGGGGYQPTSFDGLTLTSISGGCPLTSGGCGSSATGLLYGPTNGGPGEMTGFFNSRIAGFGTGFFPQSTGGISWGTNFSNVTLDHNTTGINFAAEYENFHWFGGACAVNGTCISNPSTSDIYTFGVSIDSNTVAGYSGSGNFHAFGNHFENLGSTTLNYINASGGTQEIAGGIGLDDTNSGTIATMFTTAGLLSVHGLGVFSAGRTITNLFTATGGGSVVGDFKNTSASVIVNPCTPASACYLIQQQAGVSPTAYGSLIWKGDSWTFQPTTASAIGPLRLNNTAGLNTWAFGNKDCSGAATNDYVLCGTSSIGFGQTQALRVNATTGVTSLASTAVGGGTTLSKYSRFSVSLSPALVGANTCAAQSFTVTGIAAADILIAISKPTEQAGLSVGLGHVTGANTATINFCNNTAAGITPTATETYQFVTIQ